MATRSNIIIEDDLGNKKILYHHFDGYPKGVGAELQMYLRHLTDDIDAPEKLADFICLQSKEYIPINSINTDIDYLYTIDTSTQTLHCKEIISGANELLCRYSPIIYRQDVRFVDALQALEPLSFNPIKAMHHYINIIRCLYEEHIQSEGYNLRDYLYYLRSLLASIWIVTHQSTPSVRFTDLVEGTVSDPIIREAIGKLLALKRESKEHDQSAVAPELIDFTERLMQNYGERFLLFRPPLPQTDITPKLDKLLFKYLIAFGKNYKI